MLVAGRRYYPAGIQIPVLSFTLALLIATWSILSIGFLIASVVLVTLAIVGQGRPREPMLHSSVSWSTS